MYGIYSALLYRVISPPPPVLSYRDEQVG